MLSHRSRKSILKKRVSWDLIDDLLEGEETKDCNPAPERPQAELLNPEMVQTQRMELQNQRLDAAARRLEDMFKGASAMKDTLREGVLEEFEALKSENRSLIKDIEAAVTGVIVQQHKNQEEQITEMHHQFSEGAHFYQINAARLKAEEICRVKHQLTEARQHLKDLKNSQLQENRDQYESLRELVQD